MPGITVYPERVTHPRRTTLIMGPLESEWAYRILRNPFEVDEIHRIFDPG